MRAVCSLVSAVGVVLAALVVGSAAHAKEIETTVCGADRCRSATGPHAWVTGIATLPGGAVRTPRSGRFYTVAVRSGSHGWKVVFEKRRGIVRAADLGSRTFLGRGWARLTPGDRARFDRAARGLAPMRAPPR